MPTVELPDAWALVAPCGCTDGICSSVIQGKIIHPDAEDAWKLFAPRKRDREKQEAQGYRIEPRFGPNARDWGVECGHEPKWGVPA